MAHRKNASEGTEHMSLSVNAEEKDSFPYAVQSVLPQIASSPPLQQSVHSGHSHDEGHTHFGAAEPHHQHEDKYNPFLKLLPWFISPAPIAPGDPKSSEWLPDRLLATPFLVLFYDLVLVAVLSASAEDTPTNGEGILRFFSFFVLIWYTWFSIAIYDSRFQGEDLWHRLFKIAQLVSFVYLGAASGAWKPWAQVLPEGVEDLEAVEIYAARESFFAVLLAYGIGRILLLTQYTILVIVARRVGRPIRTLLYPIGGIIAAIILLLISGGISPSSTGMVAAKVALLYTAMAVELFGEVAARVHDDYILPPFHRLGERMACLSLIVLGEGYFKILGALTAGFTAFGNANAKVYVQVVCSILIIYFTFAFGFGGLNLHLAISKKRQGPWMLAHLPTHFCQLLLLIAIVNNIKYTTIIGGVEFAELKFLDVTEALGTGGTFPPPGFDLNAVSLQLSKLTLTPPWPQEFEALRSAYTNASDVNDPTIMSYQYLGQIAVACVTKYKSKVDKKMAAKYATLAAYPTTYLFDDAQRLAMQAAVGTTLTQLLEAVYNKTIIGTLWLFPTAGGTLVFAAVLTLIRIEHRGRRLRMVELFPLGMGVVLCLLGLLDIGPKEYKITGIDGNGELLHSPVAPFFALLEPGWTLPIVTITFFLVAVGELVMLAIARKRLGPEVVTAKSR